MVTTVFVEATGVSGGFFVAAEPENSHSQNEETNNRGVATARKSSPALPIVFSHTDPVIHPPPPTLVCLYEYEAPFLPAVCMIEKGSNRASARIRIVTERALPGIAHADLVPVDPIDFRFHHLSERTRHPGQPADHGARHTRTN